MNKILYHGSSHKINILEPRPSMVISNEKAVFATNSKTLAVVFIPKWNDCDLDLGYHHNVLYCAEQYPDAFDKLKGVSGFIYTVDRSYFMSDDRLGMKQHEFISKTEVPILSTETINDVYNYLKKVNMCMITYDQKLDALWNTGLIH